MLMNGILKHELSGSGEYNLTYVHIENRVIMVGNNKKKMLIKVCKCTVFQLKNYQTD